MTYPGGKGKTYQHVINLMPPHEVYIETHLGGGAVMRHKRPARLNIGIDADAHVADAWAAVPGVQFVHSRAEDFLATYEFTGREILYVDPPYLPSVRRRERVYRHDYGTDDHVQLLDLLQRLPCMVLLSGYSSALYEQHLCGWNRRTFWAKTHIDVREETLWFNYEVPGELHDSRYIGTTFRDRQSTKRRLERLKSKMGAMDPRERAAFASWLHETYPLKEQQL